MRGSSGQFSGCAVLYLVKIAKGNKKMCDAQWMSFENNIHLMTLYRVLALSEELCNVFWLFFL